MRVGHVQPPPPGLPEALLLDCGTPHERCLPTSWGEEVEHYHLITLNRILKVLLRKQAATKSAELGHYLSSVSWVYRNTLHESTGENALQLRLSDPSEAALLTPASLDPTTISDYREQLVLGFSTARRTPSSELSRTSDFMTANPLRPALRSVIGCL